MEIGKKRRRKDGRMREKQPKGEKNEKKRDGKGRRTRKKETERGEEREKRDGKGRRTGEKGQKEREKGDGKKKRTREQETTGEGTAEKEDRQKKSHSSFVLKSNLFPVSILRPIEKKLFPPPSTETRCSSQFPTG